MSKRYFYVGDKKYYFHPEFTKYAASKEGEVINVKTGRIMKMCKNHAGYYRFNMSRKCYFIHRFVFEAIKGKIPDGYQVDHINEIKTDNRIKNLQLLTKKQNIQKSKNKPVVSFNLIKGDKKIFLSAKEASFELEISRGCISNICNKKRYRKSATSRKDGDSYSFKFLVS